LDSITENAKCRNAWSDGKLQLSVGLCEKIGIIDLFNNHLESEFGRPSDIPAGIEAAIMIARWL